MLSPSLRPPFLKVWIEATFPGLEIIWLATSGGDDQVFLVTKEVLLNYFEQ